KGFGALVRPILTVDLLFLCPLYFLLIRFVTLYRENLGEDPLFATFSPRATRGVTPEGTVASVLPVTSSKTKPANICSACPLTFSTEYISPVGGSGSFSSNLCTRRSFNLPVNTRTNILATSCTTTPPSLCR